MNLNIKKIVYITLGIIFLLIAMLGVALPVLPTTPFLLLTSYFFTKGSDTINKWFINTKLYANYVEDFIETRSLTLKRKLTILLPVSAMLLVTFVLMKNLHVRILIVAVVFLKYYYFFRHIKTEETSKVKMDGELVRK